MRLFPPIFRFDNVYHLRFRLNEALISESYPRLQRWMEEVRAPATMPQGSYGTTVMYKKRSTFWMAHRCDDCTRGM